MTWTIFKIEQILYLRLIKINKILATLADNQMSEMHQTIPLRTEIKIREVIYSLKKSELESMPISSLLSETLEIQFLKPLDIS